MLMGGAWVRLGTSREHFATPRHAHSHGLHKTTHGPVQRLHKECVWVRIAALGLHGSLPFLGKINGAILGAEVIPWSIFLGSWGIGWGALREPDNRRIAQKT